MKILGFDISTRFIGYTLLINGNIEKISHFDFSKIDKIWWDKVDSLKKEINNIKNEIGNIDHIFIEESLQTFKSGFSSAQTLSTLSKFNIITSYLLRESFDKEPQYVSAASARKICNIPLDRKITKNIKDQVFDYMLETDLKIINFDKKKTGTYKDYVKDQVDSYVIAKYGHLILNKNIINESNKKEKTNVNKKRK